MRFQKPTRPWDHEITARYRFLLFQLREKKHGLLLLQDREGAARGGPASRLCAEAVPEAGCTGTWHHEKRGASQGSQAGWSRISPPPIFVASLSLLSCSLFSPSFFLLCCSSLQGVEHVSAPPSSRPAPAHRALPLLLCGVAQPPLAGIPATSCRATPSCPMLSRQTLSLQGSGGLLPRPRDRSRWWCTPLAAQTRGRQGSEKP